MIGAGCTTSAITVAAISQIPLLLLPNELSQKLPLHVVEFSTQWMLSIQLLQMEVLIGLEPHDTNWPVPLELDSDTISSSSTSRIRLYLCLYSKFVVRRLLFAYILGTEWIRTGQQLQTRRHSLYIRYGTTIWIVLLCSFRSPSSRTNALEQTTFG